MDNKTRINILESAVQRLDEYPVDFYEYFVYARIYVLTGFTKDSQGNDMANYQSVLAKLPATKSEVEKIDLTNTILQ